MKGTVRKVTLDQGRRPSAPFAYTDGVREHFVSSKENPAFKALRASLRGSGESRTHTLLLGSKLIEDWCEAGHLPAARRLRAVGWIRLEGVPPHPEEARRPLPTLLLPESRMRELTDMPSVPDRVLHLEVGPEAPSPVGARALGAWGVQDPGNLGALLRSAAAFGFTDALLGPGCADPFAPKALRGAMGAAFRLDLRRRDRLDAEGGQVWALDGGAGAIPLPSAELAEPLRLWVGNEGHGWEGVPLPPAVRRLAIPIRGMESLNAAVAGGIACYEVARRLGP